MRVPQDWTEHEFEDVFRRLRLKTYQIPTSHYEATGKWPIVDQGKRPIAGYTSRDNPCDQHPFIVFGDHTCEVKFVDFQCFLGADGTQPLTTTAVCDLKFGFQILGQIRLPALGYSRHFKELQETVFALPPLPEQGKIADILTTWDEALTQLEALIEAQERRKKALMQQLLTGRRRLKGFDQSKGNTASDRFGIYPADWKRVRLGEITHEVPTKNAQGTNLPVLSCTKHSGLVLSEEYFGKRVYAEDTSGYRVVQRSEFAYATNHIEEGSIGYQNLCDAGLVSPIYTVFKTTEAVDDSYLFRLLKSPLLIHFYQINTSASVDRRGSLRYDEFSSIQIWLPGKEEQTAIAQVFDTADQQLTLLRTQRTALDQQKRGLMQRLLNGAIRVKP